jgi:HK97 family phage portal protein
MVSGFGSEPLSLGLNGPGERKGFGLSFDAVNVGWYSRNGFPGIYSILSGGLPAWSGEPVSIETALNHSVVYACYALISESIGMIPAVMLQKRKGEKRVCDGLDGNPSHPMYTALHDAPNPELTAMEYSEMSTGHCVLQGNAYSRIVRRSGPKQTAIELYPLQPQMVFPDREKTGQKRLVYVVKESDNEQGKTYTVESGKPHDILHIRGLGWDGIRGFSVITMGRQSFGSAISVERNIARFYANGGRVPYYLELEKPFETEEDFAKFRSDWERTYAEPHRAPMLESWAKYHQIGMNARDAQMLEQRLFNIHEVCRWFRVSPHLVGDLSRATFSNIEQLALEFVKMTLSTWITRWEQALWRCVLTDEEKAQGYFWKHNINALLRGDFASRMSGYATMLQNGIASVNEVRDLEDWNPIEGGEDHHIQLNMQSLPGGNPTASQQAALVKLGPQRDVTAAQE